MHERGKKFILLAVMLLSAFVLSGCALLYGDGLLALPSLPAEYVELQDEQSIARAKELIREICETNGRLSDRAITEQLHEKGIVLSRRTVAKYRAEMEIESSYQRTDKEKD